MDTCNIESIQKPEETIYNIRLFIKIIRTIWKLIIMTLSPVSIVRRVYCNKTADVRIMQLGRKVVLSLEWEVSRRNFMGSISQTLASNSLIRLAYIMRRNQSRAAVGIGFQSPYPSHTHRKPVGIPTENSHTHRTPKSSIPVPHIGTPCVFSFDAYFCYSSYCLYVQ